MAGTDSAGVQEPKNNGAKPIRRDAVGAEIPVTVHASRTNQGLGKNLPAVHEDTKTVIILQQGAVVRLTANLTTGETVVLTNRMTGTDVLCRVGNVKSQPGIQHYVDLEFIQRAPSFWGDHIAATSAPVATQPPVAAVPSIAPSSVLPKPAPVRPQSVAPVAVPPVARPIAAVPKPPVQQAPVPPAPLPVAVAIAPPPVRVAPAPPVPTVEHAVISDSEPLHPAPLAEPIAPSWAAPQASSVQRSHSSMTPSTFGNFDADVPDQTRSSSQKVLLGVAAAFLLVLIGGAGGYWFYSRQSHNAPIATQQPASSATVSRTTNTASASNQAPEPAPVTASTLPAPETKSPAMDIMVESRPSNPASEAPAARLQPAPIAAARTPVARHSVPVESLKAPKVKTASVRSDSAVAPPTVADSLNFNDTTSASTLLASALVGPAPPPVNSGATSGGQIRPPQLITSPQPAYPPTARMQRVQGVVMLDALVDENGKVTETKVIGGPPQLVAAAQDAVRKWKYQPAQLNGKPITVHEKVSVKFTLQQ